MRLSWVWPVAAVLGCATQNETRPAATSSGSSAKVASAAPVPAGPPAPASTVALAKGAQLFDDLGTLHRPITTTSPEAQAFFDQGLRLAFGFNHDESTRSFARSAELDPRCAACFWGVAWTLGPNYNVPMLPDRSQAAWEALKQAQQPAGSGSNPLERELIAALSKRYRGPEPLTPPEQGPLNVAFADAMREVAHAHPADDDLQVIFAESLMDVTPWRLWSLDGKESPGTKEIVATLETVLARNPNHPGANHYYIHAVEASRTPERAVPSADRLGALMPGAGHIVHMPAHIFQRVGRYADAAEANRRAVKADQAYFNKTAPPGYYPMYLGHNYGFLAYAASMQGRSAESLQASREAVKAVPPEMLDMMPGMDFFAAEQLLVMVRFGMWNAILNEPRPPEKYQTLTALWLHAQGMAHASTGKIAQARAEVKALRSLARQLPPDQLAGQNSAREICQLGAEAVEARIAERSGRLAEAIRRWEHAVAREDTFAYDEPADWFYPMRHYLGAALLDAKRAPQAERVFREDLTRNPNNGWALYGLSRALAMQNKRSEADQAQESFHVAWSEADIKLARTAF
jgi:tetratricopeptide (TPR) repeat protein